MQARIQARDLRVETELESTLPPIHGDRFLLGQALANLVDNAIEFSPAGGRLRVRLAGTAEGCRVQVLDDGPGIPEFASDRIFERFYSLPRPNGAKSSGIGLSFVREVAGLHGGRASVSSNPEGGSIAELFLPRI
jgi:two-component system sensor histidine kinase CreC